MDCPAQLKDYVKPGYSSGCQAQRCIHDLTAVASANTVTKTNSLAALLMLCCAMPLVGHAVLCCAAGTAWVQHLPWQK